MSDPLVNASTGKPCKGARAARALAAIVLDPSLRVVLTTHDPRVLAQAEAALAPFGYPGPMPSLMVEGTGGDGV